jgi:hypothetical protein
MNDYRVTKKLLYLDPTRMWEGLSSEVDLEAILY